MASHPVVPGFISMQEAVLKTAHGTVVVRICDMQKRATNFAYLVESVTTGELFIAWPDEARIGAMKSLSAMVSKTPLAMNPNVSIAAKCFVSRSYIPF